MVRAVKSIGLDTEATGLDIKHGARPFFVSTCNDVLESTYWHWYVDPFTRQVEVDLQDVEEIQEVIDDADIIYMQNSKFDVAGLTAVGIKWTADHWRKVLDTLYMAHLLASNQPHGLTALAMIYCGMDIDKYDKALKAETTWARRYAAKHFPEWRLAKKGLPEMPSAKETVWKYDTWLPGQLAEMQREDLPEDLGNALLEYGNADPVATMSAGQRMMKIIKERGLDKIYRECLKRLPIVYDMEETGVTISKSRMFSQRAEFTEEAEAAERECVKVAKSKKFDIELPKSGVNNSLREFVFDVLKLPVVARARKGKGGPSLDKAAIANYLETLPEDSAAHKFLTNLQARRKRRTALQYMEGYERFWKQYDGDYYVLYPSLNPTGTDTLRWSSSNPNEQNISKQEDFNLRYSFGPSVGREWWSLDAKNIELRLPAYEAGEEEMIRLFEHPDEPPYFGSNHLLVFDILHTKRLGLDTKDPEYLLKAKKKYASTWYQWTKNGNFAVQYGAIETSGTADKAYHVKGAQARIQARFTKSKRLNQQLIEFAEEHGYVETMPDRTVDPERGYPLLCTRTSYNKILPTVPLNYRVQGTAMWWMMKAMIRVKGYLNGLNRQCDWGYHMIMQVHDELVFDFPYEPNMGNLPKIKVIAKLMAQGGEDLLPRVPTPVSIEYHPHTWSEGVAA